MVWLLLSFFNVPHPVTVCGGMVSMPGVARAGKLSHTPRKWVCHITAHSGACLPSNQDQLHICGAQCKMQTWDPLVQTLLFQAGHSRALNQAHNCAGPMPVMLALPPPRFHSPAPSSQGRVGLLLQGIPEMLRSQILILLVVPLFPNSGQVCCA